LFVDDVVLLDETIKEINYTIERRGKHKNLKYLHIGRRKEHIQMQL